MPSGAQPGERRGGRARGTPNKKTEAQIKAVTESGMAPLDYLVSVFRDEEVPRPERIDAAKAAAPYVHSRLSSMEFRGQLGLENRDILEMTDDDLRAIAAQGRPSSEK